MKAEIHSQHTDADAQQPSWWPLDCLRPLGRAASIAAGGTVLAPQLHAEYRGFRIVTTGQNGAYFAHITHHLGKPIRVARQIRHRIDTSRFASPQEALQHARFVIASGAFNPGSH